MIISQTNKNKKGLSWDSNKDTSYNNSGERIDISL